MDQRKAVPLTLPAEQRETGALLARLAGKPPIETPLSAVFVGADTVWKLRRAIKMPFVDFTPLATRAAAAERELALNQVWAPALYRDVVAVTAGPNGPELGGTGAVIDHVVRMARVADTDFLLAQAESGLITPVMLDLLGDLVANMHAALPPMPEADPLALEDVTDGNVATALASGLPQERVQAWHDRVRDWLDHHRPWFRARGRAGFIRRCHGDLHLGNLCLFHGQLTPFDALEFNEAMATIDTGYDLSFLLMDLDIKLGRAAANRVMNRYLARNPDLDMLRAMPVFLSLRALVRAHVAANTGKDWRGYLDYAEAVLTHTPPVAIGIGGLPGTGKSTLARSLAPRLGTAPGAVILRSDEIRKRLQNVAPEQRLPASAYTPEASQRVMRILFSDMQRGIDAGQAVIADLTFLSLEHRRQASAAAGLAPFLGIWLSAPLAVLEARVAARHGDASDATPDILRQMAAGDPGPGDWVILNAASETVSDELLAVVRNSGISC
jgi:aminoglycoside phosphotransferase family enzyme/predicted kinase